MTWSTSSITNTNINNNSNSRNNKYRGSRGRGSGKSANEMVVKDIDAVVEDAEAEEDLLYNSFNLKKNRPT